MAADAEVIDMADLNDLEPLSKKINTASDDLTKTLEAYQQRLNALALGVEAWLTGTHQELRRTIVDAAPNGRTVEIQEFGYGRLGDGWALLVRTMNYEQEREGAWDGGGWEFSSDSTEVERKPLLKASRHQRVKAVELISDLIAALKREATHVIDAVEKAKKIADNLK